MLTLDFKKARQRNKPESPLAFLYNNYYFHRKIWLLRWELWDLNTQPPAFKYNAVSYLLYIKNYIKLYITACELLSTMQQIILNHQFYDIV